MQRMNVLAVAHASDVLNKLCSVISFDASLRLCGRCSTGAEALALAATSRPDVVALDVELPGEDGYALIGALRASCGARAVAMSSAAGFALKALDAGAADFVYMPLSGSDSDLHRFAEDAVDRIKATLLCGTARQDAHEETAAPAVRLAVIACAGGGPVPLAYLLKRLKPDGPAALIHLKNARIFNEDTSALLTRLSGRIVEPGEDGMELSEGRVVLLFGTLPAHVEQNDGKIILRLGQAQTLKNPMDRLFDSAAQALGKSASGILLAGSGDGYEGLLRMAGVGATTMLRNKNALLRELGFQAPGGVAELPLEDIGAIISRWVSRLPEPSFAAIRGAE